MVMAEGELSTPIATGAAAAAVGRCGGYLPAGYIDGANRPFTGRDGDGRIRVP